MGNQGSSSKLTGLCGTDYFQKMKEKYGNDAVQFIVAHKCKEHADNKFSKIGADLSAAFTQTESKTHKIAEQKINQINEACQQMKQQINSAVPGGIERLEESKGQPFEIAINLNKYTSQITQLKEKTLKEILLQKNRISTEISEKHKMLIDSIQSQTPNIPIYYDMSQSAQKQIMKKGQIQYSAQIQSKKQTIFQQIDKHIRLDQIKQLLANLVPFSKFQELANSPKQLFSIDNGITQDIIDRLR